MNESVAFSIFVGVVALFGITFGVVQVRGIRRRGGVAGALVGADIEHTLADVPAHSTGISAAHCRVHRFDSAEPERAVGIELTLKTRLSYDGMTAALSPAEARALADHMRRALGDEPAPREPKRAVRDGPV